MKPNLTGIAAALLLSACGVITPIKLSEAQPAEALEFSHPGPDTGKYVFLLYPTAINSGGPRVNLYVDTVKAATIKSGHAVTLYLPAGNYAVSIESGSGITHAAWGMWELVAKPGDCVVYEFPSEPVIARRRC